MIAEAAGVSHQTVLNHFESKEGVAAAAADILARETGAPRAKARPGDHPGAIAVLVGEYERIGDANVRWATSSQRLGSLASRLDEARAAHQEWLERIFADRLPSALAAAARRRALLGLHAATDAYTWKLLRRDLQLPRDETERIMRDLVEGALNRLDRHDRRDRLERQERQERQARQQSRSSPSSRSSSSPRSRPKGGAG